MTTGEFADLVEKMRESQKVYFRTRTKAALEASKNFEKKVDQILQGRRKREEEAANPTLFDIA